MSYVTTTMPLVDLSLHLCAVLDATDGSCVLLLLQNLKAADSAAFSLLQVLCARILLAKQNTVSHR